MSRLKYIFFFSPTFETNQVKRRDEVGGSKGFLSKRLCFPWKNQRKVPWERPNRLSFTHGFTDRVPVDLSSGLAEVDSMAWHASCA